MYCCVAAIGWTSMLLVQCCELKWLGHLMNELFVCIVWCAQIICLKIWLPFDKVWSCFETEQTAQTRTMKLSTKTGQKQSTSCKLPSFTLKISIFIYRNCISVSCWALILGISLVRPRQLASSWVYLIGFRDLTRHWDRQSSISYFSH